MKINNILRNFILVFLLLLIEFIICSVSIILPENSLIFSNSSGLYFFSALLQANAAILSIVGVYFIFQLQKTQSNIDIVKSALLQDNGHFTWPITIIKFDKLSLTEKKSKLEEDEYTPIKNILSNWIEFEEKIVNMKSQIKFPTYFLSIGIIIFSFGILSANYVHHLGDNFELLVLLSSLYYEIIVLIVVVKAIATSLE